MKKQTRTEEIDELVTAHADDDSAWELPIIVHPEVLSGVPVFRGTRVPVTVVVGSLAGGMTFEETLREYDLTPDDIRAALRFVGEIAEQESFHPLPVP